MITIMIPTRKRVTHLHNQLLNIIDITSNLSNIEIIYRIDNDDHETIKYLQSLSHIQLTIKFIIGDRLKGYGSLSTFNQEMYEQSNGDWLWYLADDTHIITPNWDSILLEQQQGWNVLLPNSIPRHGDKPNDWCEFPIIPRNIPNHINIFCPLTGTDAFYNHLGYLLPNLNNPIDITFKHQRYHNDETGLQVKQTLGDWLQESKEWMDNDTIHHYAELLDGCGNLHINEGIPT